MNQEVEEGLEFKIISMKTDSKRSHLHSSCDVSGIILGALQVLTRDGCKYFCSLNEKLETLGV